MTVMHAYEVYIDGQGWANTPGFQAGAGFDQGSNVSLWAEVLNWLPAALLTDARVQWQGIDETTALLKVPFGSDQETLIVRFDPDSGGVHYIEAMKFNAATKRQALWINGIWFDDGRPWVQFDVEEILYNVDVHATIHAPHP